MSGGTLTLSVKLFEPVRYTDGSTQFVERETPVSTIDCRSREEAERLAADFKTWNRGAAVGARYSEAIDL